MNPAFWQGRRVLVTGHTGFKGSWLSLWLHDLGAVVRGFALPPATDPNLFEILDLESKIEHVVGDIRDLDSVVETIADFSPEIVLHLAAQPIVRLSYDEPVPTFATNVMGTAHVLEAVRSCPSVRGVVVVTTDKCYENREWVWGYREDDPMGGHDPYSASKGAAEIVTAAYRRSFFGSDDSARVASARAGNVVGGGDWTTDRLVTDSVEALSAGAPIIVRSPNATRPWQHVLEPLGGYLLLAERLGEGGDAYADGWNFGPVGAATVRHVIDEIVGRWGDGASWKLDDAANPHEAHLLKLDISKADQLLGWRPRLDLDLTLDWLVDWYRAFYRGDTDMVAMTRSQIDAYQTLLAAPAATT